jgi:hypothetical protein
LPWRENEGRVIPSLVPSIRYYHSARNYACRIDGRFLL